MKETYNEIKAANTAAVEKWRKTYDEIIRKAAVESEPDAIAAKDAIISDAIERAQKAALAACEAEADDADPND